jgi:hypothetical protein
MQKITESVLEKIGLNKEREKGNNNLEGKSSK